MHLECVLIPGTKVVYPIWMRIVEFCKFFRKDLNWNILEIKGKASDFLIEFFMTVYLD